MNNKSLKRNHYDGSKLEPLLNEKEWDLAARDSKKKHPADLRRREKIALKNMEYFKDAPTYDDAIGSDYDDYYN